MNKLAMLLSGIGAFGLLAGSAMAQDAKPMPAPAPAPAATTAPVMIGGCDSGCCSSPCTTGCFNSCCDNSCEKGGGLIASFGFWILTPRWSNNPAGYLDNDSFSSPHTEVDFGFNNQFVPRIDLGYIGSGGLGARIGWWGFSTSSAKTILPNANQTDLTPADPLAIITTGDGEATFNSNGALLAQAKLHMDVWTFEAVDQIETGKWDVLLSGGVRYAHVSQQYNAVVTDADGFAAAILSGHNFNGAGPTFGIEGRRHIGNSGLYLYGNGRLSVLFGETNAVAVTGFGTGATPADAVAAITLDSVSSTTQERTVIPVGELEIGIGFQRAMSRATLFFEMGFVGQVWWGAGNSSQSNYDTTLASDDGNGGRQMSDNLGLIGFSMKAGLGW